MDAIGLPDRLRYWRAALALIVCVSLFVTAHAAVLLQLRTVEGEGSVYAVGARATRGITVVVTDETGRPVDGAAVSFGLPQDGPGGVFQSGLKTEVVTTKADGRATVWGMQWNRASGPFEIRVTAAKDGARAGIVVGQYLSEMARPGGEGTFNAPHRMRHRLLLISAVAAGAAAGMVLRGAKSGSAGTAAPTQAPQVGTPSIVISHP